MDDQRSFLDLMTRVRQGDSLAANQLVRQYEPEMRRAVRLALTDPAMLRSIDSVDVCQSVLANFFVRAASGQFDFENPNQLRALLSTMARNRFRDHVRRQKADRRDTRRTQGGDDAMLQQVPGDMETPSQIVCNAELLDEVRRRLSDEERHLAEQRASGRDWQELADELGVSAEALRKRLTRAMDRVTREMNISEGDDE